MNDHSTHEYRANRVEDLRLITGAGKYASDWNTPGQLYACFVRSERAHAQIVSVDTKTARAHAGVLHVYTGEDAVKVGYTKMPHSMGLPGKNGTKALATPRPALAHGKVRFVGEPLALVVATSAAIARDAAELISVEYEDLPVAVNAEDALAPGASQLHDNTPGNLALEFETGNAEAVEAAFAKAAHITRLKVESTRVAPSPLEPRACRVAYDAASGEYLFNVCNQGITTLRQQLSTYTGIPEDKLYFENRDVGGGFGQRTPAYPEYPALMLAAKDSGKPVKWVSTRVEGFLSDTHGRANIISGELALDRDGKFLAMRMHWINDMGAYLAPGPLGHLRNTANCMTGAYRIPALYANYRVVLTNTAPVSSYRGAGRPDIAYAVERIVNHAAAELGIDAVELRKRNFLQPDAFPYKTPTGATYENADFPGMLAKALKLADADGFAQRRAQSAAAGKLRGFGVSTVIENTGQGPDEDMELKLDASGTITAHTVTKSQGQSHETTLAMVVADTLGIPHSQVKVVQCAPRTPLKGGHTGGSRNAVGAGSLCYLAAQKLIEEGKALAALELNLEPSQVTYAKGEFRSRESTRSVTLADLAKEKTLSFIVTGKFPSTFPNGCHVVEVEVDPQTGSPKVVAYTAVDDCGVIINHAVVEGQLHGAIAQGAGQVFGEHVVYDRESGQMLSASFMDYPMPHAGLIPPLRMADHPTASKISPIGVKGVGESGCTASIPALANGVLDALRPLGVQHLDMPLTPSKLWHAIQAAK